MTDPTKTEEEVALQEPDEEDVKLARKAAATMTSKTWMDYNECFSAALYSLAKQWRRARGTGDTRAAFLYMKMKYAILDDTRNYLGKTVPKGSVTSCESDVEGYDLSREVHPNSRHPADTIASREYKEMALSVIKEGAHSRQLVEGHSATETAEIQGVTVSAVSQSSQRLKTALKRRYPNETDAPWNSARANRG